MYCSQWENRNEFVIFLNVEVSQTRRREKLESAVDKLYRSQIRANLIVKDQHLMDDTLETILTYFDAHLQAWHDQMEGAIIQQDHVFIPENASYSTKLCQWMLTLTTSRCRNLSRYHRITPTLRAIWKRSVRYKCAYNALHSD